MHCFERVRRWRHLASPKHSLLTLGSADQQIRRGSGCTRLQRHARFCLLWGWRSDYCLWYYLLSKQAKYWGSTST